MTHQLIKRGPKQWSCEVCHQSWTYESKAWCPGVPIIAYKNRGTLMSKTELGKRGYKNGDADLPPSPCSYRMNTAKNDVLYVKLYDPAQCTLKRPVKHKVVHHVDHLAWPKAWLPFLEALIDWKDEHHNERGQRAMDYDRAWQAQCLEVARQASSLLCFDSDDMAALGEETVTFTFALSSLRTRYEDHGIGPAEAQGLIELLLGRYQDYKWRTRPPLTAEEIAAQAARRAEDEWTWNEQYAARRAKQFEPPAWMTDEAALPPPVQLPMFGEG